MLEEIQRYTESVKNGSFSCTLAACPHCRKSPEGFTRHDGRRRTFLVIIGRLIQKIISLITRWKCPLCGRTFTVYPPFALRHKRYLRQTVLEMGSRYVAEDGMTDRKPAPRRGPEDRMTYRKAVTVDRMPVFHDTTEAATDEGRVPILHHSTLHRWLTSFSKLTKTLRKALRLIREKCSTSRIFREPLTVHPRKYRSTQRRIQLQTCLRLFQTGEEYEHLFSSAVFPHLATTAGWQ